MKHRIVIASFVVLLSVLTLFYYGTPYYWLTVFIILFGFSIILFFGTWILSLNYFITSTHKGKGPGISLTFDDGPDKVSTPKILDILDQHNVKATFFLIGKNVDDNDSLVKEIISRGHLVGSHSYNHDNKTPLFSTSKLVNEIQKGQNAIEDVTGKKTIYFRPPFGLTNPRYASALKITNVLSIGWSLRSMDTMAKSKEQLVKKLTSKVKPGDVVLLHDNCPLTVEALPDFLSYCSQKGIIIVPLDENLGIQPYANE